MNKQKVVACALCNVIAPVIKLYAAATTVDRQVLERKERQKPVERFEAICEDRVALVGEPGTPKYKPIHMLMRG